MFGCETTLCWLFHSLPVEGTAAPYLVAAPPSVWCTGGIEHRTHGLNYFTNEMIDLFETGLSKLSGFQSTTNEMTTRRTWWTIIQIRNDKAAICQCVIFPVLLWSLSFSTERSNVFSRLFCLSLTWGRSPLSEGLLAWSSLLSLSTNFWHVKPSCTSGGWPETILFEGMPERLCERLCMCVHSHVRTPTV